MPEKKYIHDTIGFVELLDVFGDDTTVVNAARVSFSKEISEFTVKDAQLIEYLAKHNHVSPFFHPQLRFRIKMPIFLAREWWRHTIGFARNEMSRRYVDTPPDFFMPNALRKRDQNIKQGSSQDLIENNEQELARMRDYFAQALTYYNKLLRDGVCPEQARIVLPQSMYTEFIETASLAGYARLANLRLERSAQKEIQEYAGLASRLIEPLFPVSWKALVSHVKL